jgi:hypothetical protein
LGFLLLSLAVGYTLSGAFKNLAVTAPKDGGYGPTMINMKASQVKATGHADSIPHGDEAAAPWSVPGPQKEAWKSLGNRYDLRNLEASRPPDLRITISPPRQFASA